MARSVTVHLTAANAYDPEGDGQEHDADVPKATDGDPTTSWETEDYHGSPTFGNLKDGVGIVLDAGRAMKLGALTFVSDTPGFVAEVKAGSSSSGPFPAAVSSSETVGSRRTFRLSVSSPLRYYLIWITRLAPGALRTHISEVTAG